MSRSKDPWSIDARLSAVERYAAALGKKVSWELIDA